MTDETTGLDIIRAALNSRARKLNTANLARSFGISAEALDSFARGQTMLADDVLKALVDHLWGGGVILDAGRNSLTTRKQEAKPLGVAPPPFDPAACRSSSGHREARSRWSRKSRCRVYRDRGGMTPRPSQQGPSRHDFAYFTDERSCLQVELENDCATTLSCPDADYGEDPPKLTLWAMVRPTLRPLVKITGKCIASELTRATNIPRSASWSNSPTRRR